MKTRLIALACFSLLGAAAARNPLYKPEPKANVYGSLTEKAFFLGVASAKSSFLAAAKKGGSREEELKEKGKFKLDDNDKLGKLLLPKCKSKGIRKPARLRPGMGGSHSGSGALGALGGTSPGIKGGTTLPGVKGSARIDALGLGGIKGGPGSGSGSPGHGPKTVDDFLHGGSKEIILDQDTGPEAFTRYVEDEGEKQDCIEDEDQREITRPVDDFGEEKPKKKEEHPGARITPFDDGVPDDLPEDEDDIRGLKKSPCSKAKVVESTFPGAEEAYKQSHNLVRSAVDGQFSRLKDVLQEQADSWGVPEEESREHIEEAVRPIIEEYAQLTRSVVIVRLTSEEKVRQMHCYAKDENDPATPPEDDGSNVPDHDAGSAPKETASQPKEAEKQESKEEKADAAKVEAKPVEQVKTEVAAGKPIESGLKHAGSEPVQKAVESKFFKLADGKSDLSPKEFWSESDKIAKASGWAPMGTQERKHERFVKTGEKLQVKMMELYDKYVKKKD